jgi:hypothetical protein
VGAALFFASVSSSAQVSVSKPANTDEKMPCPMCLDVKLGALAKRPSLGDVQVGHAWFSEEMQKYMCHTERVSRVMVFKKSEKHGRLEMSIMTTVKREQWRQDVDLTVTMLDPDGKPVCSNTDGWRPLQAK